MPFIGRELSGACHIRHPMDFFVLPVSGYIMKAHFSFFLYGFVIKCWIKPVILVVLLAYVVKTPDKKIVIYACTLIIL